MKVTVDADKCEGHNRCIIAAPALFDTDDPHHLDQEFAPRGNKARCRR